MHDTDQTPAAPTLPTVLVCDDEQDLRRLMRDVLEGSGYAVVEAVDGDQALDLARSTRPSVVVLDLMMPGRSGLEVLAELRADPGLARLPVIVLTARTQAHDRTLVRDAGADRFVAKPFSPLALAATVGELLVGASAAS